MGKIITVAIHKGGTGKTTSALHLAWAASAAGRSVLFVDMDPQANASHSLGVTPREGYEVASRLFADVEGLPAQSADGALAVIPADDKLLAIERMGAQAAATYRCRLRAVAEGYDVVVVDTPPSMGFGMLAPLLASDYAFSPIVPDAYGVQGVKSLFARIKSVRGGQNPGLRYLGLLPNRVRAADREQIAVLKELRAKLGSSLLPCEVAERAAIAAAAHKGRAVWDKPSGGAAKVAAREMRAAVDHVLEIIAVEKAA